MKIFKMGFDSNIREIKVNFSELKTNNVTKVEPNNLNDLLNHIYSTIGTDRALTITPRTDGNKQHFIVRTY